MEWLNNQWVIGIGTSIISGVLVFLFTRKFFTEKQKREYNQKIRTANNEILYAIRPLIVEKTKPETEILNAVLYSTARKYGVELVDIYDKTTLCDDLINEIMSNSFLSSDQKIELTKMINELKNEGNNNVKEKVVTIYRNDKSNSSTYMAMLVSLMTAMTALVFTFYISFKDKDLIKLDSEKFPQSIAILFIAMLIPVMALTMTRMLKYIKEKESYRKDKEIIKSDLSKDDEIKNAT
ncbi:MAG: hypothetical protein ACOCWM_05160 [Cyclobacteriaceae bacterium]